MSIWRNLSVRRDDYSGWRLYWQGCPDLFGRSVVTYRYVREKAWCRRVAVAVAIDTVWGSMPAFRYASRRGYPSAVKGTNRREVMP